MRHGRHASHSDPADTSHHAAADREKTGMTEYLWIVDGGYLHTPVRYYEDAGQSGRRVTLIATVAVAGRDYCTALSRLIAGQEAAGAVVYCQRHGRRCDDRDVIADEQIVLDELDELSRKALWRLSIDLAWMTRDFGLGWPAHWHLLGPSDLDVIQQSGLRKTRARLTWRRRILGWAGDQHTAVNRFRLMVAIAMRLAASRTPQQRRPDLDHGIVFGAAQAVLVRGDRDTVLICTPAQGPCLDAGIRAAGFTNTGTEQFTVMRLPRIRTALRLLITARRGEPARPTMPRPAPPNQRRYLVLRAVLTGVGVGCDGLLAVLMLGWLAQHHDQMPPHDQVTLGLLGVSAAIGVVILVVALTVTLRTGRGDDGSGLARISLVMAWVRLLAVIAAAAAFGLISTGNGCVAVLAVIDSAARWPSSTSRGAQREHRRTPGPATAGRADSTAQGIDHDAPRSDEDPGRRCRARPDDGTYSGLRAAAGDNRPPPHR
jgi:hypothetical protein